MPPPKRTVKAQPEGKLAQLLAVLEARTKLLAFFFGLCFVAALLVLAIWFPEPTPFQYTVFRITLALAASGVAGVIPGMIRLKVQPGAALLIHAGGALAVFVIVYLFAPAALPSELPVKDTKKEVKPAEVRESEEQHLLINNNQGGNIQINNYGITKEQFEDLLKKKKLEVIEEIKQSTDAIQRVLLEQQVGKLQEQLADISKSYEKELKRRMTADERNYLQNTAVTLSIKQPDEEYQRFAANVILRWKQVDTDEEALQRQQLAQINAPEVAELKKRIAATMDKLSQALHQPKEKQNIKELIERLNQDEAVMLTLAQHFKKKTGVEEVIFDRVSSNLPENSALVEYRFFQPIDFKTGNLGERHLSALLLFNLDAKQQVVFRDLGPVADVERLLKEDSVENVEVYNKFLGPFDDQIKNLKQLYIAPDGPLYFLIFASLRLPDGRFLVERQHVNQLQTGRDLLVDDSGVSGKGLVTLGGAKYGPMLSTDKAMSEPMDSLYQQRTVRQFENGFTYTYLPESRKEAQFISNIFANNSGEQATVLLGDDASEYNLKRLKHPPRILHIATHSFYIAQDEKNNLAKEAPLLLSGLALAGANNGLQGKLDQHGDDGLLYSLEVLGLNLHGTELVSLSACDTGKGVVDYSEGVYGLVRAFRTAGAKNVLMTLTPVGDASSRKFMETFYDKWLSSERNISPAEALHQTRLQFIRDKKPVQDWAPFVLVGKVN